jgi:hypothetical protein
MRLLAVVTLFFLPLATVAGVFGTQLIKIQDEKPFRIQISQDFWLLWAIAVPLTVLVVSVWWVWYIEERAQINGESPTQGDNGHGYMGWRRLKKKFGMKILKGKRNFLRTWKGGRSFSDENGIELRQQRAV